MNLSKLCDPSNLELAAVGEEMRRRLLVTRSNVQKVTDSEDFSNGFQLLKVPHLILSHVVTMILNEGDQFDIPVWESFICHHTLIFCFYFTLSFPRNFIHLNHFSFLFFSSHKVSLLTIDTPSVSS